MKFVLGSFALIAAIGWSAPAVAGADDAKWVAKCLQDNANAKDSGGKAVPVEVVAKYCTCMNNKMDDNETLSITAWEKSHPTERKVCDKESGWDKL
jgi:hypothetical protein